METEEEMYYQKRLGKLEIETPELQKRINRYSEVLPLLHPQLEKVLGDFEEKSEQWNLTINDVKINKEVNFDLSYISSSLIDRRPSKELLESLLEYVKKATIYFPDRSYDPEKIKEMEAFIKSIEGISAENKQGSKFSIPEVNGELSYTISEAEKLKKKFNQAKEDAEIYAEDPDEISQLEDIISEADKMNDKIKNYPDLSKIKAKINFIKNPPQFEVEVENLIKKIKTAIEVAKKPGYVPEEMKKFSTIVFYQIFYTVERLKKMVDELSLIKFDLDSKEGLDVKVLESVLAEGEKLEKEFFSLYFLTNSQLRVNLLDSRPYLERAQEYSAIFHKLKKQIDRKITKVKGKLKELKQKPSFLEQEKQEEKQKKLEQKRQEKESVEKITKEHKELINAPLDGLDINELRKLLHRSTDLLSLVNYKAKKLFGEEQDKLEKELINRYSQISRKMDEVMDTKKAASTSPSKTTSTSSTKVEKITKEHKELISASLDGLDINKLRELLHQSTNLLSSIDKQKKLLSVEEIDQLREQVIDKHSQISRKMDEVMYTKEKVNLSPSNTTSTSANVSTPLTDNKETVEMMCKKISSNLYFDPITKKWKLVSQANISSQKEEHKLRSSTKTNKDTKKPRSNSLLRK
jgi:hypothetical protein